MGYTELGRKRPIEIQGDLYDKILIYKHRIFSMIDYELVRKALKVEKL